MGAVSHWEVQWAPPSEGPARASAFHMCLAQGEVGPRWRHRKPRLIRNYCSRRALWGLLKLYLARWTICRNTVYGSRELYEIALLLMSAIAALWIDGKYVYISYNLEAINLG